MSQEMSSRFYKVFIIHLGKRGGSWVHTVVDKDPVLLVAHRSNKDGRETALKEKMGWGTGVPSLSWEGSLLLFVSEQLLVCQRVGIGMVNLKRSQCLADLTQVPSPTLPDPFLEPQS